MLIWMGCSCVCVWGLKSRSLWTFHIVLLFSAHEEEVKAMFASRIGHKWYVCFTCAKYVIRIFSFVFKVYVTLLITIIRVMSLWLWLNKNYER